MILILTIIAVVGAVAVSLGRPLMANIFWICSNPAMAVYNFKHGEIEMAWMFAIYSIIAVYGVWNLKLRKYLIT